MVIFTLEHYLFCVWLSITSSILVISQDFNKFISTNPYTNQHVPGTVWERLKASIMCLEGCKWTQSGDNLALGDLYSATETDRSSGWYRWYSLETLKLQRVQWIPGQSPWRPFRFNGWIKVSQCQMIVTSLSLTNNRIAGQVRHQTLQPNENIWL